MSKHLERQIETLKQKLLYVGTLVEEAVSRAVAALVDRDPDLARRVIAADAEIDRMEVEVEEECLKCLALHQPVAADLRFVVAVLKMNNDLERIGDMAKNIAKRVVFLCKSEPLELPGNFRGMAAAAQSMFKRSLDALVNSDTALARQVREDDDEVDTMRKQIQLQVEREIMAQPQRVAELMSLNNVAKQLERLADMATNIAEDVIYMLEGDIVRHNAHEVP
ncbi:MAG: phosphate signaling complex protein PhoU [Pirellulales bacterium]